MIDRVQVYEKYKGHCAYRFSIKKAAAFMRADELLVIKK